MSEVMSRSEIMEYAEILKWSVGRVKVEYITSPDDDVVKRAIVREVTKYHDDVRDEMIRFTSTDTGVEHFYPMRDVYEWKNNMWIFEVI